ncbi:C39 family peptidase [Pedobacter miscanthi]|uniref:C39 family peptidase n=1 Tax=Pedobacter miscanthi TaxID=2259170 RepID=UPI00292F5BE5|nr:C39 family peptidase [Pedobacter miscanthi]
MTRVLDTAFVQINNYTDYYWMKNFRFSCIALILLFFISCKKETVELSSENKLLTFSVVGQLSAPIIDETTHKITVTISPIANISALSCIFSVSSEALVTINNNRQVGNTATANFSMPAVMNITAPNGNTSSWTIVVNIISEEYGLGKSVIASKSIEKTFKWYFDQAGTGQFSAINCGPTVATMAVKWSDSTFIKTPEDARNTYRATGGWWYTDDIVNYLNKYGINSAYTALPDNYQTIKKYIDQNYIVILCLDNYYIRYNTSATEHVDKYYRVNAAASGHFIIVKGYKQVDNQFYFEVYDPWSYGASYTLGNQLKGENRYYRSDDLETATNVWWDYAIIVAPKGKSVVKLSELSPKAQLLSIAPSQHGG